MKQKCSFLAISHTQRWISLFVSAEIKKFLPLASYLAKELQSEEIDQGKVVVANCLVPTAYWMGVR